MKVIKIHFVEQLTLQIENVKQKFQHFSKIKPTSITSVLQFLQHQNSPKNQYEFT